ncbi:MAG: hypothetical protein LBU67_08640 [Oscillospiraceae bacterium]|jgi:hypothetical protein|nr:hypothetical protein [Oscillospiraceae bacterium]
MMKYIGGEIYRLLRKKSIYIYFSALATGYVLLTLLRASNLDANDIVGDAMNMFSLLPVIAGGFLFAAVYTDDLAAKNLAALVGFGLGKVNIVLAKLVLCALLGAVIYALGPLVMYVAYAMLGFMTSGEAMALVYTEALRIYLLTTAYMVLSGVAVYGLQRTTFAMVTYLLLALGVVSQLLSLLLNWEVVRSVLPSLSNLLMPNISMRLVDGFLMNDGFLSPLIEYILYVAIAAALSIFAFYKKEIEF